MFRHRTARPPIVGLRAAEDFEAKPLDAAAMLVSQGGERAVLVDELGPSHPFVPVKALFTKVPGRFDRAIHGGRKAGGHRRQRRLGRRGRRRRAPPASLRIRQGAAAVGARVPAGSRREGARRRHKDWAVPMSPGRDDQSPVPAKSRPTARRRSDLRKNALPAQNKNRNQKPSPHRCVTSPSEGASSRSSPWPTPKWGPPTDRFL